MSESTKQAAKLEATVLVLARLALRTAQLGIALTGSDVARSVRLARIAEFAELAVERLEAGQEVPRFNAP